MVDSLELIGGAAKLPELFILPHAQQQMHTLWMATGSPRQQAKVRGCAEFEYNKDDESTVSIQLRHSYPLKLLVPDYASTNPGCKLLYMITYGGGLVEGDSICLDVQLGKDTTVVLTSQASTKVYHSEAGLKTSQKIHATIGDGALLAVLPNNLVCFKDAKFEQNQVFHLSSLGSVIILDWLTAGRMACNEFWDMESCLCHNKVYINGRLVYGDAMMLCNSPQNPLREKMKDITAFGTCVFIGPYFKDMLPSIQEKVDAWHRKSLATKEVIISASQLAPLCDGIVVKLFSMTGTETAKNVFSDVLADVIPRLGGDPLQSQ